MKLKIVGKPVAVCSIDMKQFKTDYKEELKLKECIEKNFNVIDKGQFNEIELFKYVYLGLDWGRILDLINEIDEDVMEIRFFKCEFEDKIELAPDLVSEDGRLFVFKQEIKNGIDTIMINSFTSNPDYDISSYLNMTSYNFGKVRWKPLVDLKGGE